MNSGSAEDLNGDGLRQLRAKKLKIEHEPEQDEGYKITGEECKHLQRIAKHCISLKNG
jgi:hypothetical protein